MGTTGGGNIIFAGGGGAVNGFQTELKIITEGL
jgi:hypothetical protein